MTDETIQDWEQVSLGSLFEGDVFDDMGEDDITAMWKVMELQWITPY